VTAVTLEAAVEVSPAEVDAVVVSLVVAVAVTLAVFADAVCALSAPVVLARSRVAALLLAAASLWSARRRAWRSRRSWLCWHQGCQAEHGGPHADQQDQCRRGDAAAQHLRPPHLARRMRAASGDRTGFELSRRSACKQCGAGASARPWRRLRIRWGRIVAARAALELAAPWPIPRRSRPFHALAPSPRSS